MGYVREVNYVYVIGAIEIRGLVEGLALTVSYPPPLIMGWSTVN